MQSPRTTPEALISAAQRWPDAPAIRDTQWSIPATLTWSQLLRAARDFAAALIDTGVAAGDRVAIWAPNSYHWPIAALGTHYAGATLVPLNTRYQLPEALDIVERSAATVVVASGDFLGVDHAADLAGSETSARIVRIPLSGRADSTPAGLVEWHDFTARASTDTLAEADRRAAAVAPEDLSDILFTSGTTGRSKGVLAEHRQSIAGAHAWGANGRLSPDDRYLMVNPYFHTFGYKAGILACMLFGTSMVPLAVYSPAAAIDLVESDQITVFPGAPTIFQTILDAPERAGRDLSSLRLVVTGAAIVPVVLIERIQSELGVDNVITAYGLSETSGFVSTCTPEDDALTVATTCGRAFEGMEISLAAVNESGAGEVLARGPMVMRGYLDDPGATAEAIDADGWLHTGDIGTIDEQGNLRITDRLKDMYIAGGFNVYPAEVEQVLARIPGVTESAVIGVPDERLGEVGRAYLTVAVDAAGNRADITEEQVIAFAREQLANFKVPRSVVIVDALPRNAAGKVLKRELS